jgi:hypothetical protein
MASRIAVGAARPWVEGLRASQLRDKSKPRRKCPPPGPAQNSGKTNRLFGFSQVHFLTDHGGPRARNIDQADANHSLTEVMVMGVWAAKGSEYLLVCPL